MLYRPATWEELFNLWRARAQNIIERAFGVIKWHFKILVIPPEYSMDVQAKVFPALAAIHNCILERDPIETANIMELMLKIVVSSQQNI